MSQRFSAERGDLTSYVIIPARLQSTRLPRKLLLRETGKSVLQHTYEAALLANKPAGVCIAADHQDIADEVRCFGGQVRMTDPSAASGTDRIAEIAAAMPEVDVFVNVQGDEPEISPAAIDSVIRLLEQNETAAMSTLATPIRRRQQLEEPSCVKVVFDEAGRAMYFSRSPIPCARQWDDRLLADDPPHFFQHIGIYAFRRSLLLEFPRMPRPDIERLENLEQLRVLQAGHTILVGTISEMTVGIDTAEDYRAFVARMRDR